MDVEENSGKGLESEDEWCAAGLGCLGNWLGHSVAVL